MLELTLEEQAIYTKFVNQIRQSINDQNEVKLNKSETELSEHIK